MPIRAIFLILAIQLYSLPVTTHPFVGALALTAGGIDSFQGKIGRDLRKTIPPLLDTTIKFDFRNGPIGVPASSSLRMQMSEHLKKSLSRDMRSLNTGIGNVAQTVVKKIGDTVQANVYDVTTGVQDAGVGAIKVVQNVASEVEKNVKENIQDAMVRIKEVQSNIHGTMADIQKTSTGIRKEVQSTAQTAFEIQELFKESPPPDNLFGRLRPKPFRRLGSLVEGSITSRSADHLLEHELRFLPANTKGAVKDFVVKNSKIIFDALCKGKQHQDPRIRDLARMSQNRIATLNPDINPRVTHIVINFLCTLKRLPFR